MGLEKLRTFNISVNDILTYLKKYENLINIFSEINLYNFNGLIESYLNFSEIKSIFGALNIEDEMYVLIYNNKEHKYGAVKIQDDNLLFYDVIIYSDNKKYQSSHDAKKIKEHGFSNIEDISNNLPNNIRDVKFEKQGDEEIQNYFLAYIPIEFVEYNLKIKPENEKKFRCKYKVPLRLEKEDNKNMSLVFYIPTAHPLSKDDKKDFIIC